MDKAIYSSGYQGLPSVTMGYHGLPWVTMGYQGLPLGITEIWSIRPPRCRNTFWSRPFERIQSLCGYNQYCEMVLGCAVSTEQLSVNSVGSISLPVGSH